MPHDVTLAVEAEILAEGVQRPAAIRKLQLLDPHQRIDTVVAVREIDVCHRKATDDFCDGVLALQSRIHGDIHSQAAGENILRQITDQRVIACPSDCIFNPAIEGDTEIVGTVVSRLRRGRRGKYKVGWQRIGQDGDLAECSRDKADDAVILKLRHRDRIRTAPIPDSSEEGYSRVEDVDVIAGVIGRVGAV